MLHGRLDWLWPSLDTPPKDFNKKTAIRLTEMKNRIHIAVNHESGDAASDLNDILESQVELENHRASEVSSKLTTIVGYLPVAASMLLALMAVANSDLVGHPRGSERYVAILAIVITVYVFLQIVLSCRAALGGLERQQYPVIGLDTLLPTENESPTAFRLRRAESIADALFKMEELNNTKVSQMAVAHRALRNAMWGFLAMCIVLSGLFIVPTRNNTETSVPLDTPAPNVHDAGPVDEPPSKQAASSSALVDSLRPDTLQTNTPD